MIITSQVDPKGWMQLFEDSVITEAIVDRLTKIGEIIRLRGGLYHQSPEGVGKKKALRWGRQ